MKWYAIHRNLTRGLQAKRNKQTLSPIMPNSFPLLQRIAQRAKQSPTAPAIIDAMSNRTIDYATLYADICNYAKELEATVGQQKDLQDARVGILAEKGYPIVVALLATFAAGGLAIPLLTSLPQPEHHYMLSNGTASLLLHDKKNEARAQALKEELPEGSITLKLVPDFLESPVRELEDIGSMPELSGDRKAMMLFTSGTVSPLHRR
jgi:malonyl-CoA/methylmalonyl-CoA synthetase